MRFLGYLPEQWAPAATGPGRLMVATNYFANFPDPLRILWDHDNGTTLVGVYDVPSGPTSNPNPSPGPVGAALQAPPFVNANPDYAPRLFLSPPAVNASDATFFFPPSRDFYDLPRFNAPDLGAVENPAAIVPSMDVPPP